jgi:hypothetical protein
MHRHSHEPRRTQIRSNTAWALDELVIAATFPFAMVRAFRRQADFFRRFLAAGAAALVFALGLFAVSPVLHDWLHGHDTPADDGCAVVLFAAGVSVPLGAIAITPPAAMWREAARPIAREIFLASPRYLRQPERGPPVLG